MPNHSQPNNDDDSRRWLTLPNLLTILRIIGSPVLVVLALLNLPIALGILAIILVLTEWLDGLFARLLHQESATGARLDTVADAIFYSSLLAAVVVFSPTLIGRESPWIAAVVVSYLLSWLVSWIKFRRLPSYHTWAAKGAWFVVGAGVLCLFTGWSAWVFRAAMICVVATNLEAVSITLVLAECKVNVYSIWHALRVGK